MARTTPPHTARVVIGPPAGGPLQESWARARRPFVAAHRRLRRRWLLRRGIREPGRWGSPFVTYALVGVLALLSLLLVLWLLRAVYVVVSGHRATGWTDWLGFNPDQACSRSGISCGALTGAVVPVAVLALSTMLFLLWRLWRVHRFYARRALREPARLVETAGELVERVVGRDRLCDALMDNLREEGARRPQVVVGGVGTGKTALLVRLTELLASRGAVPVPVSLREADRKLDFCQLARSRFDEVVESHVKSDGERDRIWRWLRQRKDRIVVLADGLEDALSGERVAEERDNRIRAAIRRAGEEGLPLVITSRPHDPLRAMEAAVSDLEPLGEETVLEYVAEAGGWRADRRRLDRIVETANMAESPLYLQIARDLHRKDLLEQVVADDGADGGEQDQWALRYDLLTTWVGELEAGTFHPELPLDPGERRTVVECVSALACIGLAYDKADVDFARLHDRGAPWNARVAAALEQRVGDTPFDLRVAATWGRRLGLVEERGDSVRFQHSVIQAFLGARYLDAVLGTRPSADGPAHANAAGHVPARATAPATHQTVRAVQAADTTHLDAALRTSGRELLMALVLHSRSLTGQCRCAEGPGIACPVVTTRERLRTVAGSLLGGDGQPEPSPDRHGQDVDDERRAPHLRALEMYGAASDIDLVDAHPDQEAVVGELRRHWATLRRGEDELRLRAAKLGLVQRMGTGARQVPPGGKNPAYESLYRFCSVESDFFVRSAIVKEIGAGGDAAYRQLYPHLGQAVETLELKRPPDPDGDRAPRNGRPRTRTSSTGRDRGGGRDGSGGRERRMRAREQEREQEEGERRQRDREIEGERERWFQNTTRARILPMLVDSASLSHHRGSPFDDLERWVGLVTSEYGDDGQPDTIGRHGLGLALARGFKYAANRRSPGTATHRVSREFLAQQAEKMLKRSPFWFTRLTLLHALTLWALPDNVGADLPMRGQGADPRGQVEQWLRLPDGRSEHPFVTAAADLAVEALETRHPERFLWIDEEVVASQVGSSVGAPDEVRWHDLWIAPSTGWSTLDPTAQQLLADVLLLVVLGERGYRPREMFGVLDRGYHDRSRLPWCLSTDRTRLAPVPEADGDPAPQPGAHCQGMCEFGLCPFPAKTERLRLEFDELFCMHQRYLLRRWQPRSWRYLRFRREAPWQRHVRVAGMRRFWEQMADRAQDRPSRDRDARDPRGSRLRSRR